jgi:hypothetical protein
MRLAEQAMHPSKRELDKWLHEAKEAFKIVDEIERLEIGGADDMWDLISVNEGR